MDAEGKAAVVDSKYADVSGVAKGSVMGADAGLGIQDGSFRAEAIAYGAAGRAGLQLEIGPVDITLGVKGCAGCVGGAVKLGASGDITLAAAVGVGLFWTVRIE